MKKILIIAAAFLMTVASVSAQVTGQFVVSGHGNNKILILDVESNKVVWEMPLAAKENSNSMTMLEGGRLLAYTTQLNCKVVNLNKEVVFEYKASSPGRSEVHSVVPMRGGGFAVFESGTPAKIIEFSKTFNKVNEITFDGGSTNKHNQFRQAILSKKGTWLVPCFAEKEIREYDKDGIMIDSFKVGAGSFGIREGAAGMLFLGLGDSHKYGIYNTKKKEFVKQFDKPNTKDYNIVYNAQFQRISKDHMAIANWTGHRKAEKTLPEPQVMILDNDYNVIWAWNDEGKDIGKVSGFFYSKKPIVK